MKFRLWNSVYNSLNAHSSANVIFPSSKFTLRIYEFPTVRKLGDESSTLFNSTSIVSPAYFFLRWDNVFPSLLFGRWRIAGLSRRSNSFWRDRVIYRRRIPYIRAAFAAAIIPRNGTASQNLAKKHAAARRRVGKTQGGYIRCKTLCYPRNLRRTWTRSCAYRVSENY